MRLGGRRQRGPRALVLLYHRVATPERDDPSGQIVSPETFERHLSHLRDSYEVVDVRRVVEGLGDGSNRDGTVAVTFDDGYADNLTAAYPIAARLEVPLTFFVTVRPVVEGAPFWWDELAARLPTPIDRRRYGALHDRLRKLGEDDRRRELDAAGPAPPEAPAARPLSIPELRELAARPNVGIGAHTLTHPVLSRLPAADQRRELCEGRSRLEELVGRPVELLAYPYGKRRDHSRVTRRLAAECGYRAAFTSSAGPISPSSSRYALGRLSVHEWPEQELARRVAACFA